LGNITDICSDKTGTLTQGKMVATDIWFGTTHHYQVEPRGIVPEGKIFDKYSGNELDLNSTSALFRMAMTVCALCNTASIKEKINEVTRKPEWVAAGSPTDVALQVLASKARMGKKMLKREYLPVIQEYPFDSTI